MFIHSLANRVFKVSEKVPLRILLVVPFVLQICAVVGVTGWISLRSGQKAVQEVTTQLHREITQRLEQHLNSYLKVPQIANHLNADAINLGLLNINDLPTLERYFWNQLQTFDSLGYLALGKENGDYVEVLRQNDGQFLVRVKDAATGTSRHTYTLSEEGKRGKFLHSEPDYDPRRRAFYQTAVKVGGPTWTDVYLWIENRELSTDAVRPIFERTGTLQGVLDAGSSLSQIGAFLQRLKIAQTGQTFIIERTGELIATSTPEKPFVIEDGTTKRLQASKSRNSLTRRTTRYLTQRFGDLSEINSSQQLTFKIENRRQFLRVTPLREGNNELTDAALLPDWLMVVVVPETDFQERIDQNTRSTIMLCLGALVLATLLGCLTYQWITQPILRLAAAATALTRGEWNQTVPIERCDELGVLARAFYHMAQQLQGSFVTLSQRQATLAEAQRIAHVGSGELDLTTNRITGSEELLRIFGLEPGEMPRDYSEYMQQIHPEDVDAATQAIAHVIQQGEPCEFDCRLQRPDGSIRYISTKWQPTFDRQGQLIRYFATVMDITDRKLAAQALQQAKLDLEIRVQERTAELSQALEQLQQSEMQLKAQALQLQHALADLQQTQAQLIHTEKMSSLGQLVAGIAHEINNPVSFIYGNLSHAKDYSTDLFRVLQLYQEHYPLPPPSIQQEIEAIELDFLMDDFPQLLSSMQVGAERIREIVRLLRNFARYDEAQMKEVNIHEGIDSTLMILQSRLCEITGYPAIKVIKEYGDLPLVECYAGQLNQVFMNILTNAIDAIAARCKTQVSPENRVKHPEADEGFVPCIQICTGMIELRSQEDGHPASSLIPRLFIRISDNGCGMGESVRSRIFDPFFTTKPIGTGTGLGLTTSYQIVVEHHKGRLEVTSLEGQGSEFAIELPLRPHQGQRGEKA
ncbi:PAS domain-containing protein [Microcoleus sp. FACHB-53]|nr:PAS domain-containing protein [Microcoleus sp. FACHB-53]